MRSSSISRGRGSRRRQLTDRAPRRGRDRPRRWRWQGPAMVRPIAGADKVARMFAGFGNQVRRIGATLEPHQINGQPGVIFRGPHGGVMAVMSFEVVDGRVATVRSIVNQKARPPWGPSRACARSWTRREASQLALPGMDSRGSVRNGLLGAALFPFRPEDQRRTLVARSGDNATTALRTVERRVQLRGMVMQPAAPDLVIRPARCHHSPEPRAVTEDAQVCELVDDDRLERLGRREDEPPRERQPALPRGTPPARPLVADRDRGRADTERRSMAADLAFDRGARPRLEPRLEDRSDRSPVRRGDVDDDLVLLGAADPLDGRAPQPGRAGTSRRRWRSPRKRIVAPSRRPPRAAISARSRAWLARWRRSHGSRSRRKVSMCRSGSRQPRRPAAGTVTTTPRSGWMTTRRPRDRGERRSVYASGPPGNRATAGVSVTAVPVMAAAAARRSVTSAGAIDPPARRSRRHRGSRLAR